MHTSSENSDPSVVYYEMALIKIGEHLLVFTRVREICRMFRKNRECNKIVVIVLFAA